MPRSLALLAAGATLALPTAAAAAPGPLLHPEAVGMPRASIAALAKLPVVTSIAPRKVAIGKVLTIHGRNFRAGKGTNTVVFARSGGRYVFVRAGRSSTRVMKVTLPKKLTSALRLKKGAAQPTRFKIRILARRFGASFSSMKRSPIVTPTVGGPAQVAGCDLKLADSDHDGLTNVQEKKLGTDPCLADTDGDGMSDYWEVQSARDYNSNASANGPYNPYPGKRPYPNALDPSDKGIDFDGDGLTNWDEYRIWAKCHKPTDKALFMSDGTQTSHPLGAGQIVRTSQIPVQYRDLDINQDGQLTDDERDSDRCDPQGYRGDGLGNWVEAHGPMQPTWWTKVVKDEKPYGLSRYAATDFLDPDTDGDGIPDGADDVDHDNYSNADEINRYIQTYQERQRYNLDSSWMEDGNPPYAPATDPLWVQPFNPCLPDPGPRFRNPRPPEGFDFQQLGVPPWSGACSLHHPATEESWPPFDRGFSGASLPLRMTDSHITKAPEGN